MHPQQDGSPVRRDHHPAGGHVGRATLTTEAITTAALAVRDRAGPAAMSMRRIAAELGCDPMALYRHFPDREALLDAVADRALADIGVPAAEQAWDVRLTGILTAIRAAALRVTGSDDQFSYGLELPVSGIRVKAATPRGDSR